MHIVYRKFEIDFFLSIFTVYLQMMEILCCNGIILKHRMCSKHITIHAKTHSGTLRLNRAENTPCLTNKSRVVHPSSLTGLYGCNFDTVWKQKRLCVDYEPAHAFLQTLQARVNLRRDFAESR